MYIEEMFELDSNTKFFANYTNLFLTINRFMISDSQVYTALCIALLASILAISLGTTLYK